MDTVEGSLDLFPNEITIVIIHQCVQTHKETFLISCFVSRTWGQLARSLISSNDYHEKKLKYSEIFALAGQDKLLAWSVSNECPLSYSVCNSASKGGHLQTLKYLVSLDWQFTLLYLLFFSCKGRSS